MSKSGSPLQTVAAVLLAAVPAGAQDFGAPPTPMVAIKRACDAAGGRDAFRKLGVVELKVAREEVTQSGQVTDTNKSLFFEAPGPTPARTEDPQIKVIAGDDGTSGWALVGDRPDARPSTVYMVKRLITSELFPILLPFSLTWDGVTVSEVSAADAGGQAVWRLKV